MKIIVQKFIGPLSDNDREQIIAKIIQAVGNGFKVAVVISAAQGTTVPYAAGSLLQLAKNIYQDLPQNEADLLLSCGETIEAVMMAQSLEKAGFGAEVLNGGQAGIITDDHFGEAKLLKVEPENVCRLLEAGKIVLVAGQGVTARGELTSFGKNGSDICAIALGAALEAEKVEIYTEIKGITTVDPRIIPEAKILQELTYQEIGEMDHGAQIINSHAVRIAREKNIPVRVKNTYSDDDGILISNVKNMQASSRLITGITHHGDLGFVLVKAKSGLLDSDNAVRIFKTMAGSKISVDMNSISTSQIGFVVHEDLLGKIGDLLLPFGFDIELIPHCAKITLVGTGMQDVPGIMAQVVETLHKHRVKLLQTVDSEITISCLVPEGQKDRAIKVLYKQFQL